MNKIVLVFFLAIQTKMLSGIEELKLQQQINTKMLQQVIQMLQTGRNTTVVEEESTDLPADIELPLNSKEEVMALDEKLQDISILKQLVGETI